MMMNNRNRSNRSKSSDSRSNSTWLRTGVNTVLGAALLSLSAWACALGPGDSAPDFQLPGQHEPVQLSVLRGKLVYLDFWASWCGPCKQSFPWMNELQAKFGGRGLQVLAVNVDVHPEDAQRFLADTPAHFSLAFDPQGQTPRLYAIKGMPTSVLIGPDGKVLLTHSGFRPEDRAELEQRIGQALAAVRR